MTERTEQFLVTGSEGCIGSWVVRNLLESGLPVIACDIAPKSLRLERILTPDLLDRLVYLDRRSDGTRRARRAGREERDHPNRPSGGAPGALRRRGSASRSRCERRRDDARARGRPAVVHRRRCLLRELLGRVRLERRVGPARHALRRVQGGERGVGPLLRTGLRDAEHRPAPVRRLRPQPGPGVLGSRHACPQGGRPGSPVHDPVLRSHRPAVRPGRRRRLRRCHDGGPDRRPGLRSSRRSCRCLRRGLADRAGSSGVGRADHRRPDACSRAGRVRRRRAPRRRRRAFPRPRLPMGSARASRFFDARPKPAA